MCSKEEKLKIAENILKTCYWGNTTMTPEYIVENIENDKELGKQLFSAIFQSSYEMYYNLGIMKEEWVKEFIIDQNQRLGTYKREFLEARMDDLIKHYDIKDAGIRRPMPQYWYERQKA